MLKWLFRDYLKFWLSHNDTCQTSFSTEWHTHKHDWQVDDSCLISKQVYRNLRSGYWNADYGTLLQSRNLPTQASRSHYLKQCFLYHVIKEEVNFPGVPIVRNNLPLILRNNSVFILLKPFAYSNAHHLSFSPDTIDLWNSLSPFVHSCDSEFF